MCLIIKSDNASSLKQNLLTSAYQNNSDGFGGMFLADGKIQTFKELPKNQDDVLKMWDKYKDLKIPMGLHFRFTTNGKTNKSNCHPFEVLNTKQHKRAMWVMHNGPQLPTPMIDVDKSDTHQFVKWVLRPQLANNPELIYNRDWVEMLEDSIGSDKLLFLDGSNGKFVIINEDHGETLDDMWLSNTYSINRGVGSDYDVKTDTVTTYNKPSLTYNTSYQSPYRYDDYAYEYDYNYSSYDDKSKLTPKNPIDLCDDGASYSIDNLVGLQENEISEIIYHNPTGTSKMLYDMVNADENSLYDICEDIWNTQNLHKSREGGQRND